MLKIDDVKISYTDDKLSSNTNNAKIFTELNSIFERYTTIFAKYYDIDNKLKEDNSALVVSDEDIADLKAILQEKNKFNTLLNNLVPGYNDTYFAKFKKGVVRALTFRSVKKVKEEKKVEEVYVFKKK